MTWEYAAATGDRQLANSILRAPAHIRARINAGRQARGMEPVLTAAEIAATIPVAMAAARTVEAAGPSGPGVWLDNGGKLIPVTSRTRLPWPRATSTSRPATRHGGRGPLVDRVISLVAYGTAPPCNVGRDLPEAIGIHAFDVDALNRVRAWSLRAGHDGPCLELAGDRLRAVQTPHGLAIVWDVDYSNPWASDAVRAIERGHNAVSVSIRALERRVSRLPEPTDLVVRAELTHVALLPEGMRPGYPGARSLLFRSAWRDDDAELRKHLEKVLAECRFHARKAGR